MNDLKKQVAKKLGNDAAIKAEQKHEIVDISKLKPFDKNRKADEKSVKEIVDSIQIAGQLVPIIVDRDYVIIDGERRYRALLELGHKKASVLVQDNHVDVTRIVTNVIRKNFSMEFLRNVFEEHLKKRNMTQVKLAALFGLTQGRISQILNSGKEKEATTKRIRTVKVQPTENVEIVVTEKKTKVTFELSNTDMKTPVKVIQNLMKEISWRRTYQDAKKQIDI